MGRGSRRAEASRGLWLAAMFALPGVCLGQTYDDSRCRLSAAASPDVGVHPFAVAAGEVTGDGVDDLATADEGSNTITVLQAMGGGQFAGLRTLATGIAPRDVALADLDGDGRLDLLAVAAGSDVLQVWLGLGHGAFGSPSSFATAAGPSSLVVADLNADGKLDVVTAGTNANNISVLLGTGAGAFGARTDFAVGPGPSSVAIADFNADGKPDLATSNEANDTVSVLLGQGGGTFAAAQSLAVGAQPRDIVAADINGDGKADLVVANWNSAGLTVRLGLGNGSFAAATTLEVPALPTALALVDLDLDGKAELVVAHETSFPNQISILAGLGGGNFAAPTLLPVVGIRPRGLAVGDFNADGAPDLALATYTANQASVLLADCAPLVNLAPKVDVDIGSSYALRKSPLWRDRSRPDAYTHVMTHQDLDRDGDIDLVRASLRLFTSTPIEVLRNDGGVFSDETPQVIPAGSPPMRYPRKGLNGDFNDDGWPDLALLDTGDDVPESPGAPSQLYLSDGGGKMHYSADLEKWPGFTHGGAAADVDGDGLPDLLMLDSNTTPYLLMNDGLGNFSRDTSRLPASLLRQLVYIAEMMDIDSDGYVDLIASGNKFNGDENDAVIYWGGQSGLYRDSLRTVVPTPPGWGGILDFAAEDIDHDGDRDLVVSRFPEGFATGRYFQVLRQSAPRVFIDETQARMSMNTALESFDYFRMQDVNGDGHVDIFVDDRYFQSVGEAAWTNDGTGHFAPYGGAVNPALPYTSIDIADVSVAEGQSGTRQLVFEARLNRPATTPVTFNIATADGTATAGSDYVAKASNGVVIGVGESSSTFAVTVNGDTLMELDEAFTVNLGAVTGAKVLRARAFGYIENDDEYQLSVNDVSVIEGNAGQVQADFTVSLSAPSPAPVSFDIATAPGTASPGLDFLPAAQTGKTIPAGNTSAVFSVAVVGDTEVEDHESFTVNLSNPVGATVSHPQGKGRIINDDLAQLSVSDASIVEGSAGQSTLTFWVSLSHPMPNPVTFDIATASGTATAGSDFVARALSDRFMDAGRSRWPFEVQIIGDTQAEADETFTVTISNVQGATVADASGTGTIANDDSAAKARRVPQARSPLRTVPSRGATRRVAP